MEPERPLPRVSGVDSDETEALARRGYDDSEARLRTVAAASLDSVAPTALSGPRGSRPP